MKHLLFKYKPKDILLALLISLWVIVVAILIVTFIPYYYDHHIMSYHIPQLTGVSLENIKETYHTIINYMWIFNRGSLNTPYFPMTEGTLIHFRECKVLFEVAQIYLIVGLVPIILLIRSCLKDHEVEFLKLSVIFNGLFFGIVGLIASIDFDDAFVLFHKIFFRNDYWLMDPSIDPVINIFPESYFAFLALSILVIVTVISVVLLVIYRVKKKHLLESS